MIYTSSESGLYLYFTTCKMGRVVLPLSHPLSGLFRVSVLACGDCFLRCASTAWSTAGFQSQVGPLHNTAVQMTNSLNQILGSFTKHPPDPPLNSVATFLDYLGCRIWAISMNHVLQNLIVAKMLGEAGPNLLKQLDQFTR